MYQFNRETKQTQDSLIPCVFAYVTKKDMVTLYNHRAIKSQIY